MPLRSAASKRSVCLLWWGAWLTGCAPEATRYDSEFLAMGTTVQLAVLAERPAVAAQCSAAIERRLLRQGIDWYPWTIDSSGELKRLNAALAHGQRLPVSAELLALLQRAQQLQQLSDGYFDPAVAPLIEAWGFADLNQPGVQSTLPTTLARWQHTHPSLADLRINGRDVSSQRTDLHLDLGAIAKGFALQLALPELARLGCHDAALNLGGQVSVLGTVQALATVAIRAPRSDQALATLQLKAGESISTSGDYQRYAEHNGQRIHHLLDPHTGLPVTHTQAVTVVSTDATLADAASTALMAAGPDHWQRIARQLGVREVLRIDATGAIEVTAALYARLHWNPAAAQLHTIKQITL